ncbi:bifunctional 4-hydroxy-2-oxoglutarate aldolase/2-dehydro-3-deoxy-phosphogluconate aldolase [Georgenia sp. Z1491]|uniref:bifunctional 4-hydroxy-2-oxoglutarate aldolase/2-dehydro-3-deoxy-phosphogluconate aldolase n=1 Tax=Georgenia sp. Z1491 TaxID=3416707 RepID=UPI003CF5654A
MSPMPTRGTEDVLAQIESHRMVMVVRGESVDGARSAIEAAVDGGVRVVEVTYTVPGAGALIAELVGDGGDLVVGAGTVRTLEQAREAIDAGARFLVSPGLDLAVLSHAVARDVLMIPGILSATEALTAIDHGAAAVKLFPASVMGPAYLRALRGPVPGLKVMPSGGIDSTNAGEWLRAGATAVGVGGALSPGGPIDARIAQSITDEARRTLLALSSPGEGSSR